MITVAGLAGMVLAPPVAATAAAETSNDLVIASLAPETGGYAPILASLREPVRIAVDEINAAGGVGRGRQARLVTADEGIDARSAVTATEQLLDADHADAIIGPAASTSALSILDTIKDSALVCSGSNTAAQLTKDGPERSGGLYFRTSPPDKLQGSALAELVLSDGRSNIALLNPSDSYATPLASSVARALKDGGARVTHASFDPGDEALLDAARRVLRKKRDAVVVVAAAPDGARIVKTLIDQGSGPAVLPMYGNDGLYDPGFVALVDAANPGAVAGLTGTVPAADPGGPDTQFDKVFAATGADAFFSAYYYDCTILTALAAVKAKSDDPRKMAHAFAPNLKGGTDCVSFAACKQLLEQGKSIHYRGASSDFEEFGTSEPNQGAYDVWTYSPAAVAVLEGPDSQITIP